MKQGLLTILKFFLFLLVLPLVVACVLAFQDQFLGVPVHKEQWLLWGVAAYTVLHLFLYDFKEVYGFGRSVVAKIFSFLGPSADMVGAVIPIYAVLVICLGLVLNALGYGAYERLVLFLLAFAAALHIIGTARQLYESDPSPMKGQYLVSFGLVLSANLIILAAVIIPLLPEFSFIAFIKSLAHRIAVYYTYVYKVLFIPR